MSKRTSSSSSSSSAAGSNHDLPEDVVSLILSKLVSSSCSLADYVRFPAVCTTWRRAFESSKIFEPPTIKLPARLPLLLLQNDQHDLDTRYFYSLYDGKLHNFPLRGQSHHQRCHGSSYGWLLTVALDEYLTVLLYNPFNNNEIELPSLYSLFPRSRNYSDSGKQTLQETCIRKAAFSRSPSSSTSSDDHLIIAVITDEDDLGFYRLGDTHWIPYFSPFRPPGRRYCRYDSWTEGGFEDIIYYKGQFHAIIPTGLVACLDLNPQYYPNPKLTVLDVEQPPPEGLSACHWVRRYLVESSGDLLQVHRGIRFIDARYVRNPREIIPIPENGQKTEGFQVFKLMDKRWVEIKSLSGWSLFLGDNTSFSLPAYNFPFGCIKPNCIYFTDDYGFYSLAVGSGPLDCGVFNLEDGSFEARSPVEIEIVKGLYPHWVQLVL